MKNVKTGNPNKAMQKAQAILDFCNAHQKEVVAKAMAFHTTEGKMAVVICSVFKSEYDPEHREKLKNFNINSYGTQIYVFQSCKHGLDTAPATRLDFLTIVEFSLYEDGYKFTRSFPWLQGKDIWTAFMGVRNWVCENMPNTHWY